MKLNKKLIILSIVGLVLIGIIGGASFAYFSTANQEGAENTVKSGTMALLFTDGQQVTATNLAPGEYIEKTFKVKNTGNVDTRYDVYFSEVLNTFVDQSDLVYTLTSSDGGYNTTSEVQVPNTESKIVNQQLISPNEEHTYILRITFKLKETIQNDNMGRTFTAKININEYNLNNGEHFLKLMDVNGDEVDKQILATNKTDYTLTLNNTDLTNTTNIYCNNGGIPTINGNTLNVSEVTNDTVCTVSNDIVDTINNKLTTTKTGIIMTNNQTITNVMVLDESKEVIFDLNGKTINAELDRFLLIKGNIKIYSNDDNNEALLSNKREVVTLGLTAKAEISNIKIVSATSAGVWFNGNSDNCELVLNNVNIETTSYNCISANSTATYTATINGGTYYAKNANHVLYNTLGTINVNNGNFISTRGYSINNNGGIINLNNGSFTSESGYAVYNDLGTINIKGGTYKTINQSAIYNNEGEINITNGDITSQSTKTIINELGTININGNNAIINDDEYVSGIYIHNESTITSSTIVLINNKGELNINGGTYNSPGITLLVNGDNATSIINNGYFTADNNQVITLSSCNNCGFTINNGTFIGTNINSGAVINVHTPTNNSKVSINNGTFIQNNDNGRIVWMQSHEYGDYGIVEINGGNFTSDGSGLVNYNSGIINVNGGVFNIKNRGKNAVANVSNGTINICRMNLLNSSIVYNKENEGYIYYHTNAFGSVTPTFNGVTANIQLKDNVCN